MTTVYAFLVALFLISDRTSGSTLDLVARNDTTLQPGIVTKLDIFLGLTTFSVVDIPSSVNFVTFEIHTQYQNVTLSSDENFSFYTTVNGSHLGTVTLLKKNDSSTRWFVRSHLNGSVTLLVVANYYSNKAPVPGGCNQVFTLEDDPNIHLRTSQYWTTGVFQWANIGFLREHTQTSCDTFTKLGVLEYDVYVSFVKEADLSECSFMETMSELMTADSISNNGRKVFSTTDSGRTKPMFTIGSQSGQGAIYSVIVRDGTTGTVASYVSAASYACDLSEQDCNIKFSGPDVVLALLSGLAGIFLCVFGHRFFKTELVIFGFIGFTLVFYCVLAISVESSHAAVLGYSVLPGIVGSILFFTFWYFCGIPVLSVLLVSLVAGYLFSSVLFFTPFGNLSYWDTNFNYGMTFASGVLVVPVFLLCLTKVLNILSCTFVGSYGIVVCVDTFLHSSMKFIVLNSIQHATVPGYIKVINTTPFKTNDIILSVMWGVLFLLSVLWQFYRAKGKAPFPPCPYHLRKSRKLQRAQRCSHLTDERSPLLANQEQPRPYAASRRNDMNQPT